MSEAIVISGTVDPVLHGPAVQHWLVAYIQGDMIAWYDFEVKSHCTCIKGEMTNG
jgi:hypothetical protein